MYLNNFDYKYQSLLFYKLIFLYNIYYDFFHNQYFLFDLNINDDNIDSITVNEELSVADSSFSGAGIITYLDFDLVGAPGTYTDLSLTAAHVKGGTPENDISIPVKEGEIVILQTNYVISGQVYYYSSPYGGEPIDVPNVELILNKNYDGVSSDSVYSYTTAASDSASFGLDGLTVGNFNLSFLKSSKADSCDDGVSSYDLFDIDMTLVNWERRFCY